MSTGKVKQICLLGGFVVGILTVVIYFFATNQTKADILETSKKEECISFFKRVASLDNEAAKIQLLVNALESCPTTCDEEIKARLLPSKENVGLNKTVSQEEEQKFIDNLFQKNFCQFK